MKKVLFFALLLVVLGAANVNSQVRIGGNGEPYTAAILDLNADDSDTPTENKGALALPRVNLDDNTAQLNGTDPIAGMLVYNTNTTMGKGVYFWDGDQWVAIGGDGIVVDAVTDATAGGGLVRAGSGTVVDPYTLGITANGVANAMINNGAITMSKIAMETESTVVVPGLWTNQNSSWYVDPPPGCTPSNSWYTVHTTSHVHCAWSSTRVFCQYLGANGTLTLSLTVFCLK